MTDNSVNDDIIAEFRANDGRTESQAPGEGGSLQGIPLLLLHSRGARSGRLRTHPLVYRQIDGGYAVIASDGGAGAHPAWYHNVVANPDVDVEVGTDDGIRTVPAVARVAESDERERIWEEQKRDHPAFASYEEKTSRTIPVVILEIAAGTRSQ